MVMGELDIGPRPTTIPPREEIVGVIFKDMKVGLKRSTTIPCSTLEKVLMVMGEVDLGIRPELLPPIIQVILVDHQVFIAMAIKEVDIGLRPDNFLHITMVE